MNRAFMEGFLKTSQINMEETVSPPEDKPSETVVTCLSDCQYAQNPEKRCMLESVSLSQGEGGTFMCGQFMPAASEGLEGASAGPSAEEVSQAKNQIPKNE